MLCSCSCMLQKTFQNLKHYNLQAVLLLQSPIPVISPTPVSLLISKMYGAEEIYLNWRERFQRNINFRTFLGQLIRNLMFCSLYLVLSLSRFLVFSFILQFFTWEREGNTYFLPWFPPCFMKKPYLGPFYTHFKIKWPDRMAGKTKYIKTGFF